MKEKTSMLKIFPVMFGFFIMAFVDIIGITTNYVKSDIPNLTDSVVNLISLSCFFWFLILSIPTGMLMNRIGRKKTVMLSFLINVFAMCIPLVSYSFTTILVAFAFIGIGNTLLQVSLNPLVTHVVSKEKLTGTLTLGQFVKAVSSFLGPIIAAGCAGTLLGWKMLFPIYSVVSLLAFLWLLLTPIPAEQEEKKEISIKVTLSLLKDPYILAFFVGILVLVGVDVSMNMTFPKYLQEFCQWTPKQAGLGNSVYFFARTVGAFFGGIMLMKYSEKKFFIYSSWIALAGLLLMYFSTAPWQILACVAVFGIGYANLFSIIFSLSLKRVPEKANEVSALLIVGLFGGAILPPVLGQITDAFHTQRAAIIVIAIVWLYMLFLIRTIRKV